MQKSKNITLISYIDYPYYVGLTRRISGVSRVLLAKGINVKIVAPHARSCVVLNDGFSKNVRVKRFNLRLFGNEEKFMAKIMQWLLFSFFASFVSIKDVIRNRSIIQYQSLYSAFPAVIAKMITRATIIGDDIVSIHPTIDLLVLKLTDCVSTPSFRMYLYAKKLGKCAFYIPNGVEQNKNSSLEISKNISRLIFIGALTFDQIFRQFKIF